jgi:hypothetical protein
LARQRQDARRVTSPTRTTRTALRRVVLGVLLVAAPAAAFTGAVQAALAANAAPAVAAAVTVPSVPSVPTHRSLRDNVPRDIPEPTAPHAFPGYPQAPPFTVVPQIGELTFFPCTTCHALQKPNPAPRQLNTPHPAALVHGDGRFWCLECHTLKDRDHLHTMNGDPVSYDDAYIICGQCHFNRQKDWYFGAHGKRVANWQGPRQIYNCTHCHDPHDPTVKPRAPQPPPPVRAGLKPMSAGHASQQAETGREPKS